MTPEEEDALIQWANDLDNTLMKPLYVFRMAHANQSSKSSRTRMINSAKELERIVNAKAWQ